MSHRVVYLNWSSGWCPNGNVILSWRTYHSLPVQHFNETLVYYVKIGRRIFVGLFCSSWFFMWHFVFATHLFDSRNDAITIIVAWQYAAQYLLRCWHDGTLYPKLRILTSKSALSYEKCKSEIGKNGSCKWCGTRAWKEGRGRVDKRTKSNG